MIVISDTSVLNYLLIIGFEKLLRELYGFIVITPAVLEELRSPAAPQIVREWANDLPQWVQVRKPRALPIRSSFKLELGELESITVASEIRDCQLLIDERSGRLVAQSLGISINGTLGVLRDASRSGFADLHATILLLKSTTFRASDKMFRDLLEEDRRSKE